MHSIKIISFQHRACLQALANTHCIPCIPVHRLSVTSTRSGDTGMCPHYEAEAPGTVGVTSSPRLRASMVRGEDRRLATMWTSDMQQCLQPYQSRGLTNWSTNWRLQVSMAQMLRAKQRLAVSLG